jgi:hypothetical protein
MKAHGGQEHWGVLFGLWRLAEEYAPNVSFDVAFLGESTHS